MIQYSPYIEGTIPAFTLQRIVVPFGMNPAVGREEIKGFALQFKNMDDNEIVNILYSRDSNLLQEAFLNNEIIFFPNQNDNTYWMNDITSEHFEPQINQYYKVQLAYLGDTDDVDLTYSSVAIGKCFEEPELFVQDLNSQTYNLNRFQYRGIYKTKNITEPIYTYSFKVVKQATGEIIAETGEIYHNAFNDTIEKDDNNILQRISTNVFDFKYALNETGIYQLIYKIVTVNGYSKEIKYLILKESMHNPIIQCNIGTTIDTEKGCVNVFLYGNSNIPAGNYSIERAVSDDNFSKWDTITEFMVSKNIASDQKWDNYKWQDFAVEHGATYQYALRQFTINNSTNTKEYSLPILSSQITVFFNDILLNDSNHQLNVKFNPKISSFKETVQETKIDTIGGKYPFFFRNGQTGYKEIPISGLISYQMDNEEQFMKKQDLGISENSLSLEDFNIVAERKFRLKVLEWLNNGQPKMFRSPTEGNYIIRLMNISLTPNDTLGRMLYSFSAMGYEIAECNYENLQKYNLINKNLTNKKQEGVWENEN